MRLVSGEEFTARADLDARSVVDPDPVSPTEIARISAQGLANAIAGGRVPPLRTPAPVREPIRSSVSRAAKARLVRRAESEGKTVAQIVRELVERHA